MQYPKYSFEGNQFSSAPAEGYSVLQHNASVAGAEINSLSKAVRPANDSQTPSKVKQQGPFAGETYNISDQPATTWQWGSQAESLKSAVPFETPPRVEQLPAGVESFAPPVDLGQLQRVDRSQNQQQITSDIYKSPIDRPYVGKVRQTDPLATTSQSDEGLNSSTVNSTLPQRDEVTEVREFLPRVKAEEPMFVQPSPPEPATGKQVIVLRSQSPQELAEARAKEAEFRKPDAQLLTPNFESYVGSPELDTSHEAYRDQTQWKAYVPEPEQTELPPPAIFESLPEASPPKISVQNPVVEFSPPAPVNYDFEPAQEMAALPEPPPAPAPKAKENLFQSPPSPANANHVFSTASVKAQAAETAYRFDRYEKSTDVEASTTAMTVAHTTPVAAAVEPEATWLSPWWMLVCLVPFAMYLMTRRDGEVDQYYDACDEVGEAPRLPPEMIEKPGYSKSDAIYGEKDEYFASEQLYAKGSKGSKGSIAAALPMACHLEAAGHTGEDVDDFLLTETATTDSVSGLHFANSNSAETDTELDGSASPNFRSPLFEVKEDEDEDDIPDWLQ